MKELLYKNKEIVQKIKKIFVFSWKRAIFVGTALLLYIVFWKWFEGNLTAGEMYPKKLHCLNLLLLMGLFVKIEISDRWRGKLAVLEVLMASIFSFWMIEQLHQNTIGDMKLLYASLNYLLIITFYLLIHAVFNRFILTVILGTGGCIFYGLLYSFIKEFRGNGLRAADIYAVRTAMNVADGYTLVFTKERIMAIGLAITFIIISFYIDYKRRKRDRIKWGAGSIAAVMLVGVLFTNETFMEEKSVKPYLWEISASEMDHGALLDFAAGIPYLKTKAPKGYSQKVALEIESEGADKITEKKSAVKTAGQRPHIIAIMNESFADFRKLGELQLDQEILTNWDSLQENVIKGFVSVPVFGGWTANSEFEFLTGFSNAFFPSGTIPYQNYVKSGTPNLGSQLKEYGYTSIFMHPMDSTGWNRKSVYQAFDFDHMYYLDDMRDAPCLRNVISDKGDYAELLKQFEAQKENSPVFLFNVTIQNHGGYAWGGLENPVHVLTPQGNYSQAEEYFTLIRESDKALRELLDYFDQEQEPVVVCMFGDHYPKVEEELYDALENSSQETQVEKTAREYQVPFMIYANYDIPEEQYENISLNYLSALLCKTAQIPLTDYQTYLMGLYEKYPVVNVYGVKNQEGQWFTWDEAMEFEDIKEYEMVQYRNLFDKK